MTALDHALILAAAGFACFPMARDKRPTCPRGIKAASRDPDTLRELWGGHPGELVGVATGEPSKAAVLDIDVQHGGATWWQEQRQRLPATRTHRTRSGGLHLWFRHRPGLRSSVARIAPGIDVRADGGSAIWWPAAGLPVLSDAPLAPWPAWLIPAARPEPAAYRLRPSDRPPEHIVSAFAGIARTVALAAHGQRNATLFWGASRCAEMVAQGDLSRPHAEAVLIECAARTGLDHAEAISTIRSAFGRRAAQ